MTKQIRHVERRNATERSASRRRSATISADFGDFGVGAFGSRPRPIHNGTPLLGCAHYTFGPDGLIAEDLVYFDLTTMLRQLGLLPEPAATVTS